MFYHDIDPVIVSFGPVSIHWYGLMWAVAFITIASFAGKDLPLCEKRKDNVFLILAVGTLLGAKLGYILFYTPMSYWGSTVFALSGFSFHGGVLGFIFGLVLCSSLYALRVFQISDSLVIAIPWGLFWGRIGNFLNSELWGYPTDLPWAVVFARTDPLLLSRHPSQLYEAFGEGVLLGLILYVLKKHLRFEGSLSFCFIIFYGLIRFMVEFFRVPDIHIGLVGTLSQGQWLSLAMIGSGLIGLFFCQKRIQ